VAFATDYLATEPALADVAALRGRVALEFGAPWCGHCQAAQPAMAQALQGRAYRVKLWPTLVLLRDGEEVARVVRPRSAEDLAQALAQWDAASGAAPG
jgi:thioredoxin 1